MAIGKESLSVMGNRQNIGRSSILRNDLHDWKPRRRRTRRRTTPCFGQESLRTGGRHKSILSDDGRCGLKPALHERGSFRRRFTICERTIFIDL